MKVIAPDPATGLNDVTKTAYDADGNVTSTTDPLGHATTNVYNSLNEIVSTTDANGGKTSYTYDADGEQTSVTDPMGGVTSYQYLCLCQLAVGDFFGVADYASRQVDTIVAVGSGFTIVLRSPQPGNVTMQLSASRSMAA